MSLERLRIELSLTRAALNQLVTHLRLVYLARWPVLLCKLIMEVRLLWCSTTHRSHWISLWWGILNTTSAATLFLTEWVIHGIVESVRPWL